MVCAKCVAPATQGAKGLNDILARVEPLFNEYSECHGTMSYRFEVSPNGKVARLQKMTSTLQSLENRHERVVALEKAIEHEILKQPFAKARAKSFVTFPILFRF
jgi:hypothetical protein